MKATNRLILLYSIAVISAVYIASKSAYWQAVLCVLCVLYLILIIKNPKRISLYIVIPLFLLATYRTNLDLVRYELAQSFANRDEISIMGKVMNLHDNFCIIDMESIDKIEVKGKAKIWSEGEFELEVGDRIIINASPQADANPRFEGDFDYIKQNLSLHQYLFGFNKSYEVLSKSNSFIKIVYNFRQNIKYRFDMLFPKAEANTAKALLLGDMSDLDDDTYQDIKDSGASHIFAVSGQHLAIISLGIMLVLGKICRGNKTKNAISIFAILIFSILVGYSASVLRSSIMIIKYLTGFLLNRRDDPIDSIFFSAIIVLLLFPFALFTPGFLLSYSAVFGLLLFVNPFMKVNIKGKKYWGMILTGICAIIASSIFTAYFYKEINLTSIWSNVILNPLVTFGLFGVLLIAFFPFLAGLLTNFTYLCLHFTNLLISKMAGTKVVITTGTPQFIVIICFGFMIYFVHVILEKGIVPWLNDRLKDS